MKKWPVMLGVSLAGTLLWWLHRYLTDAYPPFDNAYDTVLWIICSALKLASIICVPIALGKVLSYCHRDIRRAVITAAFLFVAMAGLLTVISIFRAPLIAHLNSDSFRYYPNSLADPRVAASFPQVNTQWHVARWQSGVTFFIELGLVLAASLVLGAVGYIGGNKGTRAGVVASVLIALLFIAGAIGFHLSVWDFDTFYSGTLIGPLSTDTFFFFVATDGNSEIGFLFYTVLICSSWILDRWILRDCRCFET